MTVTFALAGKGGTGKTTLAALLIRYLVERRPDARILAIDADPASNLDMMLGMRAERTIGAIRRNMDMIGASSAMYTSRPPEETTALTLQSGRLVWSRTRRSTG